MSSIILLVIFLIVWFFIAFYLFTIDKKINDLKKKIDFGEK